MIKVIGIIVLLALIAGGGYLYSKQESQSGKLGVDANTLGSYEYVCTNDVTLRMEPSSDMSYVRLMMTGGGFPSESILNKAATANARYEDANGLVFMGAGEEVQIMNAESSAVCSPVPSNDMAPFNWGDAGEGGGVVFDPVRAASEGIIGRWALSESDVITEYKTGGVIAEDRAGTMFNGTWSMSAPADAPVVTLMYEGSPHGSSCEVSTLTPEQLVLSCTGEGERFDLSYTRAN